jgi:hypothetical protein
MGRRAGPFSRLAPTKRAGRPGRNHRDARDAQKAQPTVPALQNRRTGLKTRHYKGENSTGLKTRHYRACFHGADQDVPEAARFIQSIVWEPE